jgi:O-antigen/teichoic acid export membrane protein
MPNRQELAVLLGFGLQAFIVQVAALVIGYTDTALIGVLLGAASVTLYVLPLQLIEHSRALIGGITQSLLPELAALRARGDTADVRGAGGVRQPTPRVAGPVVPPPLGRTGHRG